jgi:hypothetical protein
MYLFHSDLIATIVSFKRDLLMGLTAGAVFSLGMFFLRPLARRQAKQDERRRLLQLDGKPHNYLLVALAFGLWCAGSLILLQSGLSHARLTPSAGMLIMSLFSLSTFALGLIHILVARRLARQVIASRDATIEFPDVARS